MKKIDPSLFVANCNDTQQSTCPDCGSPLSIKNSKSGPFLGCTRYPECHFVQSLSSNSVEVVKDIESPSCPECSSTLQIKKGRYGLFIGCSAYPECAYIAHDSNDAKTDLGCPQCGTGYLREKTNRYGKRFFSCTNYPNCRYVLNSTPIKQACQKCGWPVVVEKAGKRVCPQKLCRHIQHDEQS